MEYNHEKLYRCGMIINQAQKISHNKTSPSCTKHLPTSLHLKTDTIPKTHRNNHPMTSVLPTPIKWIHLCDNDGSIHNTEKTRIETIWSSYNIEQYYIQRWQIPISEYVWYNSTSWWLMYCSDHWQFSFVVKKNLFSLVKKATTAWKPSAPAVTCTGDRLPSDLTSVTTFPGKLAITTWFVGSTVCKP